MVAQKMKPLSVKKHPLHCVVCVMVCNIVALLFSILAMWMPMFQISASLLTMTVTSDCVPLVPFVDHQRGKWCAGIINLLDQKPIWVYLATTCGAEFVVGSWLETSCNWATNLSLASYIMTAMGTIGCFLSAVSAIWFVAFLLKDQTEFKMRIILFFQLSAAVVYGWDSTLSQVSFY
eukprot:GHVN01067862.1.p1 GENE.GHVN01067862.1~~GHVN01067862.1.p1  ORF type:complete len:177 (-),score=3.80 GHVN01067862.1:104-634(-)